MQVNVFGYENKVYRLYISKKSYHQTRNSLLTTENDKLHYVFIKDFNRLMFSTTNHKDKKHYCMSCLQSFTTEKILSNHKKQCLLINGCQAVNYESGIIKFTNYNKYPFFLKYLLTQGEHTVKYQEH